MRALICGITGQDGAWLARDLLARGYEVYGTSRDALASPLGNLHALDLLERVHVLSMAPDDFRSVHEAISHSAPDEVYFLAGQSSVGLSFDQPAQTLESTVNAVLNLLEVIRLRDTRIRFFHAGSSECFGEHDGTPADENTAFRPVSPYGVAKAGAHWLVSNYREAYGLFAVNGILYNHESPLRADRFVTRKIVSAAQRIAAGSPETLRLGRIDILRDWGWAPEFVDAMWRMLQQDQPLDCVIATGHAYPLSEFVATCFGALDLDWRAHVVIDPSLFRPTEIRCSVGNPTRAARLLGWQAQRLMPEVVRGMLAPLPGVPG